MVQYSLALMTGIDIPIPELQLALHQPTIKEISYVGEEDFFDGISCLCVNKTMFEQELSQMENITNFQLFLMLLQQPGSENKKGAVFNALTLLFPGYKPMLTPRSLVFTKDGENHIIDDSNFLILQKILKKVLCVEGRDGAPEYNPQSKKAKEIADKLMRGRQRVAAQKAKENGEGSSFVQYLSVLTIGVGSMTLQDAINLTVFQFYDLVERYSKYVNWDIDVRARMAGAKGDSELANWMENIH